MSGFSSVGYFLVTTLFSLITFILWARLFIRYFAVGTFHQLSQSIYTLTAPVIDPIHRHITRGIGARSRYDLPCLTLLVLCELLKFTVINIVFLNQALPFIYLLLYTFLDLIVQPCNLLFYAILIRTLMSWFNPDWRQPFPSLLLLITEPLLRSIRNILPQMGMLDLSPLVAIILLKAITIFASSLVPFPIF